jgi:hypothetical protein
MSNSSADRRSPLGLFPDQPEPSLYDCAVEALRSRHYSRRTEEAYLHRIAASFHNGLGVGTVVLGRPGPVLSTSA